MTKDPGNCLTHRCVGPQHLDCCGNCCRLRSADPPCFCGRLKLKLSWSSVIPNDGTWMSHSRTGCIEKARPFNANDAEWTDVETARALLRAAGRIP